MQENTFTPNSRTEVPSDKVEVFFRSVSQYIIIGVFGLLPLLFIPASFLPIDYGKVVIVIVALILSVIFFSLSVLRSGTLRVPAPLSLLALMGVSVVAVIAAIFSGDMSDSIFGDLLEVHTAFFLVLLALVASSVLLVGQTKDTLMKLYIVLTVSGTALAIFHVARILLGADVLSLGMFANPVSTPLGSWNDLGLFFGLSVLLSMVALEQLPLTKWGKGLFSFGIFLALIMLAVINFFAVWIVLVLVSLVMLMYGLTKDRFSELSLSPGKMKSISLESILISLAVFVTSLVFIVSGGVIGNMISSITDISYVEVRPSFSATVDIARNVYAENAFLGIGPNKFIDAWRLYKDPSINQTIFWSTDFKGGNGFITTLFVTTGIFGVITWFVFFASFLYTGFRMLFKTSNPDRFWYFIGSSSFIAAVYLWLMSLVYVPGATILILAALFSSVAFAASSALVGSATISLSVSKNKGTALVLVGIVMIVIVGASTSLYVVGRYYSGISLYGNAVSNIKAGSNIQEVEDKIVSAYQITKNDKYARQLASYQLGKMNSLLTLQNATPEQQQEFQNAVQAGVGAAQLAVQNDPTDSVNWSVLGSIYAILASANIEGAADRAEEAFATGRTFDPLNPSYLLSQAQLRYRTGDSSAARQLIQEAIRMKSNYADALLLLTQLEVAEGNTEAALQATQAVVSLEPNNPARYYQLGALQAASGNTSGSVVAFERAVRLDPQYANARYLLALGYQELGRTDEALQQLAVVLELNPGNTDVINLISQIKDGTYTGVASESTPSQVEEPEVVREENDNVITTEDPNTPLISTVNTVGAELPVEETPETSNETQE